MTSLRSAETIRPWGTSSHRPIWAPQPSPRYRSTNRSPTCSCICTAAPTIGTDETLLMSDRSTDHGAFRTTLAAGAFALALGCLWIVMHDYQGLRHDAQLYTFQALARLQPGLLANDIYLRYGSQD